MNDRYYPVATILKIDTIPYDDYDLAWIDLWGNDYITIVYTDGTSKTYRIEKESEAVTDVQP